MEFPTDDPFISRPVLEMLTVSHEYCLFMEKSEDYSREVILDYLLKISPLLYLKGNLMPHLRPDDEEYSERYVTQQEWEDLYNILNAKMGKDAKFYILEPEDEVNKESLVMNMAEICCDIYQDLKDFVLLYQKNTTAARESAVTQCFELFKTNWGPKLLNIMPHLHFLAYMSDDNGDESGVYPS